MLHSRNKCVLRIADRADVYCAPPQVRLQKIIEAVGVRQQIREELTVKLLLWKHDEDLVIDK